MIRKTRVCKLYFFIPVMTVFVSISLILSGICICRAYTAPSGCQDCCSNDGRSKTEQTSDTCACFVCGLNTSPMMLPAAFDEVLSVQAERHIEATHNTSYGLHNPMIQHHLTAIDSIRCMDDPERFRAIHLESTVIRI